jgi:alkylation response protein AidB-like acyl-CoA dehydrogenase
MSTASFSLSPEQQILVESVSRWAIQHGWRTQRPDREQVGLQPLWRDMAALGWLVAGLNERAGGLGGGIIEEALIAMGLGEALTCQPYAEALPALHVLARSLIRETQPGIWSSITSGESFVALAHSEVDGAPDCIQTCVVPDGRHWRISGRKRLIHAARCADHFLVSAAREPEQGDASLCLFLVPRAVRGLTTVTYPTIDGRDAGDLLFDDVMIRSDALVSQGADARAALDESCRRFAVVLSAEAVGLMEGSLLMTIDYMRTRRQFGRPLSGFQALQHRVADMFVETRLARAALWRAAAAIQCGVNGIDEVLDGMRLQISKSGKFVCSQAIQLHGAIGLTEEYAVGKYLKRLIAIDSAFGGRQAALSRLATRFSARFAEMGGNSPVLSGLPLQR